MITHIQRQRERERESLSHVFSALLSVTFGFVFPGIAKRESDRTRTLTVFFLKESHVLFKGTRQDVVGDGFSFDGGSWIWLY